MATSSDKQRLRLSSATPESEEAGDGHKHVLTFDGVAEPETAQCRSGTSYRRMNSNKPQNILRKNAGILVTIFILVLLLLVILVISLLRINNNSKPIVTNHNCTENGINCTTTNINSPQKIVPLSNVTSSSTSDSTTHTNSNITYKPHSKDNNCTNLWDNTRLPHSITPMHYNISLDIDLTITSGGCQNGGSFTGSVNISVYISEKTDHILLHAILLNISTYEVYVRKRNCVDHVTIAQMFHSERYDYFVIEMAEVLTRGVYVVSIGRFSGCIIHDLRGLYLMAYENDKHETKYLAASQLQSTDARKVFPCFDEPSMKATFSVAITHASDHIALSNMPVEAEQCVGNCSRRRVQFQTTPIMSTYLLAFVVSDDFENTQNILPNNYTLRMWSQPDMVNQTMYALGFATKTYAYFTDFFQISDVVPKADHVAVPDFSGGAMENWGLVIYRETALLYDPNVSSSSNKFMVTLIVAHEIAHTWFGNMVTMKWWDDLWLNEGFASTLMYFAMDHVYPDWHVLDMVVVEDMFPVMVKDALVTSHPVSPKQLNNPDEIAESFDQISYNKGMAVLRMLETFLGREGFRTGLQTYVTKYKFHNAEMSELWQTFTEATNSSFKIGEIMDTWTRQMGYPVINVRSEGDDYVLEQARFLINANASDVVDDSPYSYKWHVPFTYHTSENRTTRLHWLTMGPGRVKRDGDGWLIGNIDYGGYYRVNYEVDMWQRLVQQLEDDHAVFGGANRAGLIGDAFNLARASMLDYGVALNLTTYLQNEDSYVPWKAFLESLEFIRGMFSKQSAYVLLEKYIRVLVAPVFDKIGTNETGTLPQMYLRRMLLRTGCDVGVKQAIRYAKNKFTDWMHKGTRLNSDYAQVIYAIGVQEGSVEEWDHVWNMSQQTNSPSEREMMLEALAHTQKPWLLWRYAHWIFDEEKIKMQDVRLVMSYFSNTPLGRMIALHFLMNYWDDLNAQFGSDTFIIREMIGEVTAYVNTDFELRQLELLFSEKPPKGAKKGADSALALIRANIGWMNSNYKAIEGWLLQHVKSNF